MNSPSDVYSSEPFYAALGRTLAHWGAVEREMFEWFWLATGMSHDMSRSIFYSSRSFAGRVEMLESTIKHSLLPVEFSEFLKASLKKSRQLSAFRNMLAHGQTMRELNSVTGKLQTVLIEGKNAPFNREDNVTIIRLEQASENYAILYATLADAITIARGQEIENWPSLEECLERVRALPNRADSPKPNQTQK